MKDTTGLDNSDDKMGIEIPKEKRYLNTSSYDYSIIFLADLMSGDHPKIILEVPFQRNFIWKVDRSSQLIESVIMNVPIPPLYFAEEEDGRWLVLDGLQRLNTLLKFYQNEYALKGLEIINELEGLKYKDLPPKAKSLLNDGLMRINVIKKDSHDDIKYDIFMRLNKGSVTLNYQELRNCLYRGELNNEVKKFVQENKSFQKVLKLKKPHERFLDVEFIMRILALQDKLFISEEGNYAIKGYNGRMVNFINDFMKRTSSMSLIEAKAVIRAFDENLSKVIAVFGEEKAFKDPTAESLKFNKSIGEFVTISFNLFEKDFLVQHRVKIKDLLVRLLKQNETFRSAISLKTSDSDVVNFRINLWIKELNNALSI
jgi:hypothetical protein